MTTVIRFYRVNDRYGCFSNFSAHPVFLDGTTWPTSEHYFQAQKFMDHQHRLQIQLAKSPMIAAQMGRDRTKPLRDDWEQVKDDVMRKVIRAKVLQHADVRETLLGTGMRCLLSIRQTTTIGPMAAMVTAKICSASCSWSYAQN